MLPDLENLLALQDADREIARLNEEVADLPKRVAAIEEQLAGTKARLEEARAAVKADEAARKKHEAGIQDLQQKISKYREQQLAVKTNDQYKALVHEIEFAQKDIQANEDRILELMEDADNKAKQVKAAEAELKAETAEIEKEKIIAHDKAAEDEKLLTEWRGKRDQLRSGVSDDLLRHYERVAKFRRTGISEVRDSRCMECQVLLRPQMFAEVRAGNKPVMCESCQRVLFYRPPAAAAVVEKKKRTKPKADAGQAWYFRAEYGECGEVFLGFINGKDGKSSRRVYDMHTGRRIGGKEIRDGAYATAFAEDLMEAPRLNGNWPEAELDEYGIELPMIVLDVLLRDVALLQSEAENAQAV